MASPIDVAITHRHDWTDHLLSFRTERPSGFRFAPGQFVRLGIQGVFRAYSIASGPFDDHLEYYSIVVPDGAFTQPLSRMGPGSVLQMDPEPYGFLTLERFALEGDLWMLASGTGLAPFISMLADPLTWESFDRIVLVHSVRTPEELAYQDWLGDLSRHEVFSAWADRLTIQPVVTRGPWTGLTDRIPSLLDSGRLESTVGLAIVPERSKVMICGNPEMVKDTRTSLKKKGLKPARSSSPGQIATENYW